MIDWILGLIFLAGIIYLLATVIRKFPRLVSINIERVPGLKDAAVKSRILETKLKRDLHQRFLDVKNFFGIKSLNVPTLWQGWQNRLLQLERDYKRIIHKDLSSEVKKTKVLEDLLSNAKVYLDQEEYGKSEEVLIDALALSENNLETYFLLVQAYQGKKELDHAKETLEYLLNLTHNEDPKVYQSLAQISVARGDLKEAEGDYLRSISLDENNYLYYLQLAGIYQDLEDYEKALEAAKRSLILAANNPKVLDFLVELSIVLKDKEQGFDYLDRLTEVNPDNQKIDQLRKQLEAI